MEGKAGYGGEEEHRRENMQTVQTDSKYPEDTAEPVRTITWITFSKAKGDNGTIHTLFPYKKLKIGKFYSIFQFFIYQINV